MTLDMGKTMIRRTMLLLCLALVGCRAPTYLRDPQSGAVYGPVHPTQSPTIQIGQRDLALVKPMPGQEDTFRILTTRFPEYELRSTDLHNAVQEMNRMIVARYPRTKVRIVLGSFTQPDDPFSEQTGAYIPALTFAARDMSLMTAIDIICRVSGGRFEIDGDRIWIKGDQVQQGGGHVR